VLCRCDFQPGLMVDADPSQLEQTLSSLFLNAIQAMRGRGQITVRAERGTRMDRILIQDDGPGVAPEFRTRIFEPLFSTRPSGAGLGLAIARRIVERHGGTLSLVDSRFGATFEILIPRETIKPDLAPQR